MSAATSNSSSNPAAGSPSGSAPDSTSRDFILPDLGEGLTEAELIGWKVAVGDRIGIDEMVVEVESAKSVVELPSPYAGTVVALHAHPGDTVHAGQVLFTIAEVGADSSAADAVRTTSITASHAAPGSADVSGVASAVPGPSPAAVATANDRSDSAGGGANLIGYGASEPKAHTGRTRSFGARSGGGARSGRVSQAHAGTPAERAASSEARSTAQALTGAGGAERAAAAAHTGVEPEPTSPNPTLVPHPAPVSEQAPVSAPTPVSAPVLAPTPVSAPVSGPTPTSGAFLSASTEGAQQVSPVTSPIVRKLAQDHGLVAKHLAGTGKGGVVTRADVLAAVESGTSTTAPIESPTEHAPSHGGSPADWAESSIGSSVPSAGTSTTTPTSATGGSAHDIRTPISGLRKVVSERLSRSRQEIPEATIWLDVDATELLTTKRLLESGTGEKYSLLSLVARFVVAGLQKYPILNSSVDTTAGEIVTHGAINLGLAAQTPRGLMVPVVHGAGEMNLRQLRDSVAETVGKAPTGKYTASELSGGTFTLNNYGVFGVDGSAPIINLPEVAMLGLGRIKDRPWVVDGELTVRKVMYLSFVFDHRVCDGEEPSKFLTFVADCIENPITLLPEL